MTIKYEGLYFNTRFGGLAAFYQEIIPTDFRAPGDRVTRHLSESRDTLREPLGGGRGGG